MSAVARSAFMWAASRLELARLLLADFDPAVTAIFAQPLLLTAASQDQTVDRDRDQPGRHAGFARQPHGPVWSRDHVAGK